MENKNISPEVLSDIQKKIAFLCDDLSVFRRNITLGKDFNDLEKESEELQNKISEIKGRLFNMRDLYESKIETIIRYERECMDLVEDFKSDIELGISFEKYQERGVSVEAILARISKELD